MKDSANHNVLIALLIAVLAIQILSLLVTVNSRYYGPVNVGNGTKVTVTGIGYVSISATGTATAKPTNGSLYLTVKGLGKSSENATKNLSIALDQMNTSISKYINGNTSLITTTYYNVYNQTVVYPVGAQIAYPYPGYNSYNGFIAEEDLQIIIPNVKNVSGALGALSAINGVAVTSASATLSDSQITQLRTAALSNALKNATSQAESLTNNANLSVQNLTVNYYNFYPIPYALGAAGSVSNSSAPAQANPSFYSGTDSVTESIGVVFSYKK